MVDIHTISLFAGPILAPIVLTSIAAVALWSYMKVHDKRLLTLCIAFSLWATGYIISSAVGLFYNSIVDSSSLGIPILNVTIQATILLAIAILAHVYYFDRKAHGMRFTKTQRVVGALIIVVELAIVALNIASIIGGLRNYNLLAITSEANLFLWANILGFYIIAGTIYALTTYIVVSLYSSYKITKNNNTLIVMTGFAFLLSSDLMSLIYYHFGSLINLSIGGLDDLYIVGTVSQVLTLVGFVVLLVALLRLKVFR